MIKLLVDTSGKEIGIGLFKGKECLFEDYRNADRSYNKMIIPLINEAIKKAQINLYDINIFSATLGPGSFTGIRVGISVMKALSHVLNKKFLGVAVPDILVRFAEVRGSVVVLMDAGRGEFYFTKYEKNSKKRPVKYELFDSKKIMVKIKRKDTIVFLKNDIVTGEFIKNRLNNKSVSAPHIDIKVFNDIIDNISADNKDERQEPVYIRQPDAVKKIKKE